EPAPLAHGPPIPRQRASLPEETKANRAALFATGTGGEAGGLVPVAQPVKGDADAAGGQARRIDPVAPLCPRCRLAAVGVADHHGAEVERIDPQRVMVQDGVDAVEGLGNVRSVTRTDESLGAQSDQFPSGTQGQSAVCSQGEPDVDKALKQIDAGFVYRP